MRLFLLIVLIVILGGCSSTKPEPVIRTVEVKVPVLVSCVPGNLPAKPVYSDSKEALSATDGPGRYQLTILGNQERQKRLDVLEPVINGCKVK